MVVLWQLSMTWHGRGDDGSSGHLDTPAAVLESPYVPIDGALTGHLVTHQVGVVRGVDEVPAQGKAHVLGYPYILILLPGKHCTLSFCL